MVPVGERDFFKGMKDDEHRLTATVAAIQLHAQCVARCRSIIQTTSRTIYFSFTANSSSDRPVT
jgi:hypothetical protein